MKKYLLILMAAPVIFFTSCGSAQTNANTLPPTEFSNKIKADTTAVILDVRTPEEFSTGHLQNAKNFDWNGTEFEKQIETLDKSKPVYVYCHSGRRSGFAAEKMRSKGFKLVYELQGGITKWREAKLPETTDN